MKKQSNRAGEQQGSRTLLCWIIILLSYCFTVLPSSYASDVSIHGFAQGNYSFSTRTNPDGGDFKWAEERFQLKLDGAKEPFRVFIKTDAS
ncbi:MAG: hypothetical protein M0Z64_01955, partial [Nitrospiraceae bacterium]|nr:hypothetical protein [Nitrospiraceae bacterium]